MPDHTQLL